MNSSFNDYSMKNYPSPQYSGEPDLAGLLSLAKKNIESRIRGLEADMKSRQQISDQAISALSTHSAQIREQVRQAHYLGASSEQHDFTKQITKLEETVIKEMTSCFSDVSTLREKLQEAKEELEIEKQKMELAGSESYKSQSTTPVTPTPTTNYQFLPQQVNQYLPKYSVFK